MATTEIIILVIAILGIIIGLAGSLLPFVPGIPLIFLSALFYAIFNGFVRLSAITLVILGIITLFSFFSDVLMTSRGVKRRGGSRGGVAGMLIGALVGAVLAQLPGLLLGGLLGLIIGEIWRGKTIQEASRSAGGAAFGVLSSAALQFFLAFLMTAIIVIDFFLLK